MFLKISKEDLSWSRSKKALPIFTLLLAGGLSISLLSLLAVRTHLKTIELQETERLLNSYLTTYRSSSLFRGNLRIGNNQLPEQLVFVRIIQGPEQVLVTNELLDGFTFSGLLEFSPTTSKVWIQVGEAEQAPLLTVISKKYESGVIVQAGKIGSQGYGVYRGFLLKTVSILGFGVVLLWPLSLLFVKMSLLPLVATRQKVADLVQHSKTELLPEQGSGPELDSLYRQINKLVEQNRHLVTEMQASLDNVAHDLRTPMTRLRSVAEYGLQGNGDIPRLQEALSDCLEESERVLSMLRIMMSVAEAESGAMRLDLERCDVVESLQQVVTLYEYVAADKKISVTLETESVGDALLDKTRISQVWANLLDNAIKYGQEGGWVKIRLFREGAELIVELQDNGMGISETEQPKIWEKLYRGDRSRSEKGLGLGLNYVLAVVVAHRGSVVVQSRLREGSTFAVRLPKVIGENASPNTMS